MTGKDGEKKENEWRKQKQREKESVDLLSLSSSSFALSKVKGVKRRSRSRHKAGKKERVCCISSLHSQLRNITPYGRYASTHALTSTLLSLDTRFIEEWTASSVIYWQPRDKFMITLLRPFVFLKCCQTRPGHRFSSSSSFGSPFLCHEMIHFYFYFYHYVSLHLTLWNRYVWNESESEKWNWKWVEKTQKKDEEEKGKFIVIKRGKTEENWTFLRNKKTMSLIQFATSFPTQFIRHNFNSLFPCSRHHKYTSRKFFVLTFEEANITHQNQRHCQGKMSCFLPLWT